LQKRSEGIERINECNAQRNDDLLGAIGNDINLMCYCVRTVMKPSSGDDSDRVQFGEVTVYIEQCL
jgi:hypothetical protein